MLDTGMIYKRVKKVDKDEHFFPRLAGHKSFLTKHLGVPTGGTWESEVHIPLPLLVREINPNIKAVKSEIDGSHILQISMESAKEPPEAKSKAIVFESID